MKRRRLGILLALALLGLAAATGCSRGKVGLSEEVQALPSISTLEERMREAVALLETGESAAAQEEMKSMLRNTSAYRVMPELLYLIGRNAVALGDEAEAAESFGLLRRYYPVHWNQVSRAEDLSLLGAALDSAPATPSGEVDENSGATDIPQGSGTRENLVSNLFFETDIQQILADLSAQTGVPIVAGKDVRGYATIEFYELTLEECLQRLLEPMGLSWRWIDGYFLVGKPDPKDLSSLRLTETREIRPRHLLAREALQAMPPAFTPFLQVFEGGGNSIVATGPPSILDRFEDTLAEIDRPVSQVMIEAYVVDMNREFSREWGLDWEAIGNGIDSSFRLAKLVPAIIDSSLSGSYTSTDISGWGDLSEFRMGLKAIEASGQAQIKANPQLSTLDGQPAKIRVGSEAYYSLLSGSVTYSYYTLQKIATGVNLAITPYIGASSEITVDISVEVSDVRSSGSNDLPITSVREVQTRTRVDNGGTILIGGLLSEVERESKNRIPILGSIPFLGALFGHSGTEKSETEVFILLTPHILIHPSELTTLCDG